MSEERFDRLENQLTQVIQSIATMQQNMTTMQQNMTTMQQNMTTMQQNINAVREDVIALRQRIDSSEGIQNVIIREGFQSLMSYNDDLNYEMADHARHTRLLKRRVMRLERKDQAN